MSNSGLKRGALDRRSSGVDPLRHAGKDQAETRAWYLMWHLTWRQAPVKDRGRKDEPRQARPLSFDRTDPGRTGFILDSEVSASNVKEPAGEGEPAQPAFPTP